MGRVPLEAVWEKNGSETVLQSMGYSPQAVTAERHSAMEKFLSLLHLNRISPRLLLPTVRGRHRECACML